MNKTVAVIVGGNPSDELQAEKCWGDWEEEQSTPKHSPVSFRGAMQDGRRRRNEERDEH